MLVPKCWSHVTIEPALVISFVVCTITNLARSNLMLQKLCYQNGTGPVLGVICPRELEVQKELALVQSVKVSLEISCKVLIIIFSSSWKRSRKPYFLLPLCGHICLDLLTIGATYFWQSSIWILASGIGLFTGITGIGSLTTMGACLYASDNTTPEQRTLRIGIYEGIYACSSPLGSIMSGYLTILFGFYVISIMSIIGNIIAGFLIIVMIQEPHDRSNVDVEVKSNNVCEDSGKVLENGDHVLNEAMIVKTRTHDEGEKEIKGNHIREIENSEETKENSIDKIKFRGNSCLQADREEEILKNHEINKEHLQNDHEIRLRATIIKSQTTSDETIRVETVQNTNQQNEENNLASATNIDNNVTNNDAKIDHNERKQNGSANELHRRKDSAPRDVEKSQKLSEEHHHQTVNTSLTENLNPFKLCLNNFRILLKPRSNHRTTIALLMVFITMVLDAAIVGEYSLLYYYVRAKFGWNETDYGKYSAYKAWSATFGVLLAIGLLGRVFKLKDTSIGLLACVSGCLECVSYMFVTTTFQLYLVPIVDMFHVAAFVITVSILSQEIDVLELPNVLSVNSIMGTCLPLLTTPIYMMIYRHTVEVWPEAFFLLGVALTIPAFITFSIVKCLQKRRSSFPTEEVT